MASWHGRLPAAVFLAAIAADTLQLPVAADGGAVVRILAIG
jgi:hypothetical protein